MPTNVRMHLTVLFWLFYEMSESETYKELGELTKCKDRWEESIATNTPDPYREHMSVFAGLLHDGDDKVRMEAPEIFRVLGKCRPDFIAPYLDELHHIAETDTNRVVRIHCQGAIRATR